MGNEPICGIWPKCAVILTAMSRTKKVLSSEQMLELVKLRFEDGLTNQEIAAQFGKGTKQISWLLDESVTWLLRERRRLAGMELGERVQDRLRDALFEKYSFLKDVIIVPRGRIDTEEDYAKLIRRWAIAASDYFDAIVNSGGLRDANNELKVSMSGGETILEIMNALDEHMRRDVFFHASAFPGRSRLRFASHVDPATNATVAWARSGRLSGHCIYATIAPSELGYKISDSLSERKEALRREIDNAAENKPVESAIKTLDKITVAFAGLGVVTPPKGSHGLINRLTATGLLKQTISEKELADAGAVGDLAYCFFDKDGIGLEDLRFFLTAGHYSKCPGVRFYRQMVKEKKSVIVVAGTHKTAAILAALKGELFNVWITDDDTARKLLDAK
jgi:DNA-binding transcriptional regulator LsrR (DeoR family)